MTSHRSGRWPSTRTANQQGAATLIVVGVLFFIVSLVAAYTNRNLIFEQRTSANQYRATQAFEAAEAGAEWALAMLNGGRIDANCNPSADAALSSFRQRYLSFVNDGAIAPLEKMKADPTDPSARTWPSCVHDGASWVCSCPDSGPPSLSAPEDTGVHPAFRIRFLNEGSARPGVVRLQVNGCTRLDENCLDFPAPAPAPPVPADSPRPLGVAGEGHASIDVLIALKSALPSPPVAAVTVRRNFDVGGVRVRAFNSSAGSSGIAVMTGGIIGDDGQLELQGLPGTPIGSPELKRDSDPSLGAAAVSDGNRLFEAIFGASLANFRGQPATLLLDCTATACDADRLRSVAGRHPGRIIWADGNVSLNGGAALGTADSPVLLVVEGNLAIDNINVHGLVYGRNDPEWTVTGIGSTVRGALVAENDLAGGASFDVVYDGDILNRLRWQHGSFVRVPGGWRDF